MIWQLCRGLLVVVLFALVVSCRTKTTTLDMTQVSFARLSSSMGLVGSIADTIFLVDYAMSDTDTVAVSASRVVRHARLRAKTSGTIVADQRDHTKKQSTVRSSPLVSVETIQTIGNRFFKLTFIGLFLAIVVYIVLRLRQSVKK